MSEIESAAPPEPEGRSPAGIDPLFSTAMDAAPVLIWVAGPDRLCIWFNKTWLDFTGRRLERELGNGWMEGIHADDFERCLETYTSHFEARSRFRMQYRLRHNDGQYRWVDDIGVPRHDEGGGFLGFVGSCTDVQDSMETEAELKRLQAELERRVGETANRLETALEAQSQATRQLHQSSTELEYVIQGIKDYAIFMLDPGGHVASWNSGAERIKGYTAAEIMGQHISWFYTAEDRKNGLPAKVLRQAVDVGRFENEGWRVRKDGTRFWANILINAIYAENGRLLGFAKVTRDMTERHAAEQELERTREHMQQMQKMEAVGQLTGGVAHDFNNLLTVIIGNLESAERALRNEEPSVARLKRAIANAAKGAERAAALTQGLLAFSRRQPLEPKPLDLNRFIAGEVDFLQRSLGETVDVQAVGSAGLWPVEVDANHLQTALLNLAINARDAMTDGGKLTIETSNAFLDEDYCRINPELRPGQYVLLAITDDGLGMTKEVIEHAFEPFFSTKEVGQGTGLGLSQLYGFIKQSGGHVRIYSEPGEGTTVKIYLPRLQGAAPRLDEPPEEAPPTGEASETILVVEDDENVRSYLIEVLTELGYTVLRAEDAHSAYVHLERLDLPIDLLLTDVVLPGPTGREIANRALELRPALNVLFMTGYSRNAIVHQGRLDPGVELLQKPITQEKLANRIRGLLDRAGA